MGGSCVGRSQRRARLLAWSLVVGMVRYVGSLWLVVRLSWRLAGMWMVWQTRMQRQASDARRVVVEQRDAEIPCCSAVADVEYGMNCWWKSGVGP